MNWKRFGRHGSAKRGGDPRIKLICPTLGERQDVLSRDGEGIIDVSADTTKNRARDTIRKHCGIVDDDGSRFRIDRIRPRPALPLLFIGRFRDRAHAKRGNDRYFSVLRRVGSIVGRCPTYLATPCIDRKCAEKSDLLAISSRSNIRVF